MCLRKNQVRQSENQVSPCFNWSVPSSEPFQIKSVVFLSEKCVFQCVLLSIFFLLKHAQTDGKFITEEVLHFSLDIVYVNKKNVICRTQSVVTFIGIIIFIAPRLEIKASFPNDLIFILVSLLFHRYHRVINASGKFENSNFSNMFAANNEALILFYIQRVTHKLGLRSR